MPISATYRPSYTSTSTTGIRVALDGWSASAPGDVDANGTVWGLTELSGWFEAPPPRTSLVERPAEHGDFDGPAFEDPRVVTINGWARCASLAFARRARNTVASVCGDSKLGLSTLVVNAPGEPDMQAAVRRSAEVKTTPMGATFDWSIIVTAPDPRRYGTTLNGPNTGLPNTSGGIVFPLVAPYDFGTGTSGGQLSVTNAGTRAVWPSFAIRGPVTGPTVTNTDTGAGLVFDPGFTVPSGQTMTVDTDAKTVLLQGVTRRSSLFTANWFELQPGTTNLRFGHAGTFDVNARLTVNYRDGWT